MTCFGACHRTTAVSKESYMAQQLTTGDVAQTLAAYEARYGTPRGAADILYHALAAGDPVTSRADIPVHVTCGVVAVRPDGRILQIRHRTLDQWLFPGGHLEADDTSLPGAARRELAEETGIEVTSAGTATDVPIDIDVHRVPANHHKGEPEHFHADFRYHVNVPTSDVVLQLDEVTNWRWVTPDELDNPRITQRLHTHETT